MVQPDYQTPQRMALKERAILFPEFHNKTVIDIGCDMGHFVRKAIKGGARHVVGLDRGRHVNGQPVDLVAYNQSRAAANKADFYDINIGKQWHEFGLFDIGLCMSVYHHILENACEHAPIWYWLAKHVAPGGTLIWEGPTDVKDAVVQMNVSPFHHSSYRRDVIVAAAERYFFIKSVSPALHEPHREVLHCIRKEFADIVYEGKVNDGAGGATTAFEYAGGRRATEIEGILGVRPYPGSLNVKLNKPFHWGERYYRAMIYDVIDRRMGFDSEWAPRWARFYPILLNGAPAWVFRFEVDAVRYPTDFVEIIAPVKLRDRLRSNAVRVAAV